MRKRTSKQQRSPGGLIRYTRRTEGHQEAFHLHEIAPGQFEVQAFSPDARFQELRNLIINIAEGAISDFEEDPARWRDLIHTREDADVVLTAAKVLETMEYLDHQLAGIKQESDVDSLRRRAEAALGDALAFVLQFNAFRIVQHEKAIVVQRDSKIFGRRAGLKKKSNYIVRDVCLAQEFLRRRERAQHTPTATRRSDTIIKGEVGSDPAIMKKLKMPKALSPKGSIKAVNKGLEKLSPTRGKGDK